MQHKRTTLPKKLLAITASIVLLCATSWQHAGAAPPPSPDPAPMKPMTPKLAPTEQPAPPAAPAPSTKSSNTPAAKAPAATDPAMPPTAPSIEKYAQLGDLEKLMFGSSQPTIPVEYRLDRLESEVFHHTSPHWDVQKRIEQLHETLVGNGAPRQPDAGQSGGPSQPPPQYGGAPAAPYGGAPPYGYGAPPAAGYGDPYYGAAPQGSPYPPQYGDPTDPTAGAPPAVSAAPAYVLPPPGDLNSPDFQQELQPPQLREFALQIINDARTGQGLTPLSLDDTAAKVAADLVQDNCRRSTVSHQDKNGDNPDVRYTKAGGSDCLVETLCALKSDGKPIMNKTLVYNIIKDMCSHQDDRDALFNPHATHGAFDLGWSAGHDKVIACTEIVTKQGDIAATPIEVKVGEKLDIKGVITGPYKFNRITVAWEGILPTSGDDMEPQDEALPYFPPLDYEAFARKSERDWQKGKQALQLAGVALAIAGGVFFPPVALAAPLMVAATGTGSMPMKAASDIPVRGGVNIDGAAFSHKFPLSKDSKEGIYYITVWASSETDATPFAISRRAIVARTAGDGKNADLKVSQHSEDAGQVLPAEEEKKATDDDKKPREQNEDKK